MVNNYSENFMTKDIIILLSHVTDTWLHTEPLGYSFFPRHWYSDTSKMCLGMAIFSLIVLGTQKTL
jgi:hypothetical protein